MKKILFSGLIVLSLICLLCFSASGAFKEGDVTGDSKVTAADARQTLRWAVGLDTPDAEKLFAADLDLDGAVTAADARLTLRIAVGLDNADPYVPIEPTSESATTSAKTGPVEMPDFRPTQPETTTQSEAEISSNLDLFIDALSEGMAMVEIEEDMFSVNNNSDKVDAAPFDRIARIMDPKLYDMDGKSGFNAVDDPLTNGILSSFLDKDGYIIVPDIGKLSGCSVWTVPYTNSIRYSLTFKPADKTVVTYSDSIDCDLSEDGSAVSSEVDPVYHSNVLWTPTREDILDMFVSEGVEVSEFIAGYDNLTLSVVFNMNSGRIISVHVRSDLNASFKITRNGLTVPVKISPTVILTDLFKYDTDLSDLEDVDFEITGPEEITVDELPDRIKTIFTADRFFVNLPYISVDKDIECCGRLIFDDQKGVAFSFSILDEDFDLDDLTFVCLFEDKDGKRFPKECFLKYKDDKKYCDFSYILDSFDQDGYDSFDFISDVESVTRTTERFGEEYNYTYIVTTKDGYSIEFTDYYNIENIVASVSKDGQFLAVYEISDVGVDIVDSVFSKDGYRETGFDNILLSLYSKNIDYRYKAYLDHYKDLLLSKKYDYLSQTADLDSFISELLFPSVKYETPDSLAEDDMIPVPFNDLPDSIKRLFAPGRSGLRLHAAVNEELAIDFDVFIDPDKGIAMYVYYPDSENGDRAGVVVPFVKDDDKTSASAVYMIDTKSGKYADLFDMTGESVRVDASVDPLLSDTSVDLAELSFYSYETENPEGGKQTVYVIDIAGLDLAFIDKGDHAEMIVSLIDDAGNRVDVTADLYVINDFSDEVFSVEGFDKTDYADLIYGIAGIEQPEGSSASETIKSFEESIVLFINMLPQSSEELENDIASFLLPIVDKLEGLV